MDKADVISGFKQDFSRPCSDSSTFQGRFSFQGLFKKALYTNTFQACANPVLYVSKSTGHVKTVSSPDHNFPGQA